LKNKELKTSNAVSKFGIFVDLKKNYSSEQQAMIVDEGISHLPFLFQNTKSKDVLRICKTELKSVEVILLPSPGSSIIKDRLKSRGHKRLQYLNLDSFVRRNNDIERLLIDKYALMSKNFIVFGDG